MGSPPLEAELTAGKHIESSLIVAHSLLSSSLPATCEASLANLETKSTEFSMRLRMFRSNSDPVECELRRGKGSISRNGFCLP